MSNPNDIPHPGSDGEYAQTPLTQEEMARACADARWLTTTVGRPGTPPTDGIARLRDNGLSIEDREARYMESGPRIPEPPVSIMLSPPRRMVTWTAGNNTYQVIVYGNAFAVNLKTLNTIDDDSDESRSFMGTPIMQLIEEGSEPSVIEQELRKPIPREAAELVREINESLERMLGPSSPSSDTSP